MSNIIFEARTIRFQVTAASFKPEGFIAQRRKMTFAICELVKTRLERICNKKFLANINARLKFTDIHSAKL